MRRMTLEERFWKRVSPEPNTGCWLWLGTHDNCGYARMDKGAKGSRVAWSLFRGGDPGELHVCHKCDQPGCVNPDHLFLGSALDNMRDMVRKGRNRCTRGSAHPKAKLSDEQIRSMHELRALGWQLKTLAMRFGMSQSGVGHILSGRCRRLGRLP